MVTVALVAAALGAASLPAPPLMAKAPTCDMAFNRTVTSPRPVAAADLAGLRDIGADIDFPGTPEPAFTLSPDGTRIAVQVRWADPASDRYCLAMVVVDLRAAADPVVVDAGGVAQRWNFPVLGEKADFPSGYARIIVPWWSADGRSLYYLKQTSAAVQIWRAAADGTGSRPVTASPVEVADFALDGILDRIVFSVRSGADTAARHIEEEGRRGFRIDERSAPMYQVAPYPAGPLPLDYFVLDLRTSAITSARAADRLFLANTRAGRVNDGRDKLSLEPAANGRFPADTRLTFVGSDGQRLVCAATACANAEPYFWWEANRLTVIFQTREGWGRGDTAFYRWTPSSGSVQRLFLDRGKFTACQPVQRDLICAYDSALQPRRIIRLNLDHGTIRTLFNPNAAFDSLMVGKVERLTWKTKDAEAYGDLVYPTDFRRGTRYPLVVVQYLSRGFLRGGTGDEYPIQAFAGRGYFVLSTQNPGIGPRSTRDASDYDDVARSQLKGFRRRREILGGIEHTIGRLIARGLVDQDRIGITGLSEGATGVQFAGLNSKMFQAAAMSSCCWDPAQDALLGIPFAQQYHKIGWPALSAPRRKFWARMSWVDHPRKVAFPILMQLADREYLGAMASYTALQQAGRPVALYVYPDEYHTRWHPAHRLASYERSLAWFDFWLQPEQADRPDNRPYVKDWLRLKRP